MWIEVPRQNIRLFEKKSPTKGAAETEAIRNRVVSARKRQNGKPNARMSAREVKSLELTPSAKHIMEQATEKLDLSLRAQHKLLKLARTIADLSSADIIGDEHILEALRYRTPKLLNE